MRKPENPRTRKPENPKTLDPPGRMRNILEQSISKGFFTDLRPGAILHGDECQVWGDCDLSNYEAKITVPANTTNELTTWINELWDAQTEVSRDH